jgi:hypothetical protein
MTRRLLNGSAADIAGLLTGAYGINRDSKCLQGLKRNHRLHQSKITLQDINPIHQFKEQSYLKRADKVKGIAGLGRCLVVFHVVTAQ